MPEAEPASILRSARRASIWICAKEERGMEVPENRDKSADWIKAGMAAEASGPNIPSAWAAQVCTQASGSFNPCSRAGRQELGSV